MPRFCRFLCGPRVIVRPQVISGPASSGQQVWIGRRARSTSLPSQTMSWHAGPRTSCGAISHNAALSSATLLKTSRKPSGGSGSLKSASSAPTSRKAAMSLAPIANATRRVVPKRFASIGIVPPTPIGLSKRMAGPSARKARAHISVISSLGETGVDTRFRSLSCSRSEMNARRSEYFIKMSRCTNI